MARINTVARGPQVTTHEGGPAYPHINPRQQLERLVMANLLWEDQFYVDGKTVADQIEAAAQNVSFEVLAQIAIDARKQFHLRHVPLLLVDILTKRQPGQAHVVAGILERADEPAELLALHLQRRGLLNVNKAKTIPGAIRDGIELALQYKDRVFGEYGLAKYDRKDAVVKLRDVFRLVRPKPLNEAQAALWKRALAGELETPDTWEVGLSGGGDKRETFERLLKEQKLGYLALLRNLRNMEQAGVDRDLIREAILLRKGSARVLPFRYIAAARAAPSMEKWIDEALVASVGESKPLKGKTGVLVDVSASMDWKMSEKSDLKRIDAAAALASVINAEDLRVWSFSDRGIVSVPPRRGMAGVDAIIRSQPHGGTALGRAVADINDAAPDLDRLIVITDEQTADRVPAPKAKHAYMINVAAYQNGVGYGKPWTHIDGFSEAVLRFIREYENYDSDPQF